MKHNSDLRGKIVHARGPNVAKQFHLNDPRGYVIVDVRIKDHGLPTRTTYYRIVNDLEQVQDLLHSLFVRENNP